MWGPVVDSILIWKAHFVAAVVTTFLLLRGTKGISLFDKFALGWYVYDALIHIILEGSFLYMSLTGTVVGNNTHPLHFVCTFQCLTRPRQIFIGISQIREGVQQS